VALEPRLRRRTPRDLREERDALGFVRQPEVRWLSPGLLAKSGVEVLVSGTFGKFADKREIQREPQEAVDLASAGELWVDYLSDTGDGWDATYTMAWLLAQEGLDVDGERLPRADVLLLGGDQVYPSADAVAYEDRFVGPFASALPRGDAPGRPLLFALPGNHDWYDGLVSFLRVFCARDGHIGDWVTRQRRSYFSLRLPHGWWIWGIDIQLDTYIDDVQLDFFREQAVQPGDKVVLLTAKPAWAKALPGRVEPPSWRYLSYFEERVVRASGARLVATLTGDLHHYARYEPSGDVARGEPTRLTAGGGGAYLSPTHTLPPQLQLRSLDRADPVTYGCEQVYPRAQESSRLSNGILRLAALNPSFARLFGSIYAVLGAAVLGTLNSGDGALVASATADGFRGHLASSVGGASLIVVALLFAALFAGTDIVPRALESNAAAEAATKVARAAVALTHTALHVLIAVAVLWVVLKVAGDRPLAVWAAGLAALFAAGTALGATVFAAVLLAIHRARGADARANANQVFTGQSIADFKNMLRMRFGADGGLTIFVLGVDRIGRDWRHVGGQGREPRFAPAGEPPAVRAVDGPLRYDAGGRRLH
jgi:hypothetical protein